MELPILWSKYLQQDIILGLRFGSYTNYFMLDIDRGSCYHPLNNRERFNDCLKAVEAIGGSSPVIVRSSDSGGLHVYYFLPQAVHTFTLALAVKRVLNQHKLILVPGRLEIFPNVKSWRQDKVSNYNGHRLPLQHGSYLLNEHLEPISQNIDLFLAQGDISANHQNMCLLIEAMGEAQQQKRYFIYKERSLATEWCLELQRLISIGWTGNHQTNDLLITFAKYGVIFLRLTGKELVEYMEQTAISSQGYAQYCRHQHEIDRRVGDVASWAQEYYYAYPDKPIRNKTYKEQFYSQQVANIADPSWRRHEDALYRVQACIAMLRNLGVFPDSIMKRSEAIIAKSKELFDKGVSPATLHKLEYMYLWHPEYEMVEMKACVNADSVVQNNDILPCPWDSTDEEVKIEVKQEASLHVVSIYEGLCLPAARSGSGKNESQERGFETEPQGEGELDCEVPELVVMNNQGTTKIATLLDFSITLELLSIITNPATASNLNNSNSSTQSINSNSQGVISLVKGVNSNNPNFSIPEGARGFNTKELVSNNDLSVVNLLISLIQSNDDQSENEELINKLQQLINESLQSTITFQAPGSNTILRYKQNLLLILAAPSRHVLLAVSNSTPANASNACGVGVEKLEDNEESHRDQSNSQEQQESEDSNNCNEAILPQQWQAMKFKLEAMQKAKKLLREFCNNLSVNVLATEREVMEKFLRHCLLAQSCYQTLRQEAREWFDSSIEVINQIDGFSSFWTYFEALIF